MGATMETTTIMVIILTSMLHQKLHSLVDLMEMAMGPTEMAMDLMEMVMDPMEMAMAPMEMAMGQMEMAMDLMEMEMDLMETDRMDCAARPHVKCANQFASPS